MKYVFNQEWNQVKKWILIKRYRVIVIPLSHLNNSYISAPLFLVHEISLDFSRKETNFIPINSRLNIHIV